MSSGHASAALTASRARVVRAAVADVLRSIARRVSIPGFVLATLTVIALVSLASLGLASPILGAPMTAKIARASEYVVLSIFIVVAIIVADEAVERGLPRGPSYAVAIVVGAVIGAVLGWELRHALGLPFRPNGDDSEFNPLQPMLHRLDVALIGILVGGLTTFVHVNRRTALAARRRQHESEQARARARRHTLESELQALQARVEPMFLFGTLARIRRLYRSDVAAAGAMLEDLIAYLRAALPQLRESSSTVGQELTLARAWLDILGRTEAMWETRFDVAPAARDARLPALVLLPLLQQAVGAAEGTALRLDVAVRSDEGRLRIEVATSTAAFARGIAGEPLLEQIDARLHALYGDAARLTVEAAPGSAGSVARVELVHEPIAGAGPGAPAP